MGAFIVTDSIDTALTSAATKPVAVSADGISVTNPSIQDLIALKKLDDANTLVGEIANGTSQIMSVYGRPPGAGGSYREDC